MKNKEFTGTPEQHELLVILEKIVNKENKI